MKLFRVAAAFGAGALAGWAAMAFIGAKPGVEGHAATGAASRFEAAQQRIDGLEASLARLTEQLSALDATGAWQAGAAAAMSSAEDDMDPRAVELDRMLASARRAAVTASLQTEVFRRMIEGGKNLEADLISIAGVSQERAREISARHDALTAEGRARIEAQRAAGQEPYPLVIDAFDNMERTLREELGDADYARYRRAMGMSSAVHVNRVLPGSNAETAGLLDGDVILSYGGRRVMDLRELERVAMEGAAGEPVVLEVQRGDERMFVSTLHGALGVTELGAIERITREVEEERQVARP